MGATDQKRRLSIESKDGGSVSGTGKRKYRKHKTGPGKACVYCRRRYASFTRWEGTDDSHMVCEGGRPCERWLVFCFTSYKRGADIQYKERYQSSLPRCFTTERPAPQRSITKYQPCWREERLARGISRYQTDHTPTSVHIAITTSIIL